MSVTLEKSLLKLTFALTEADFFNEYTDTVVHLKGEDTLK
jgi:hypothetical protein